MQLTQRQICKALLKFPAWPKLLIPFVLGQSLAVAYTGNIAQPEVVSGLVFTVSGLLFILFANDLADEKTDLIKKQLFPASSPKPLIHFQIQRKKIFVWTVITGLISIGSLAYAIFYLHKPLLFIFGVLGFFLVTSYSFSPFKLNYRGGGEFLEVLGVGLLFPWMQFYLQSGVLFSFELLWVGGWFFFSTASAIASGLSDETSDKVGGKKTFTTIFGNAASKKSIQIFYWMGTTLWIGYCLFNALQFHHNINQKIFSVLLLLPLGYTLISRGRKLHQLQPHAKTECFAEQKKYKASLHQGMWASAIIVSVLAVLLSNN